MGTITAEEPHAQLRIPLSLGTAFADARLGSPDCSGGAMVPDPCPCRGVLPEQICPLCLVGHLGAMLQGCGYTWPVTTAQAPAGGFGNRWT